MRTLEYGTTTHVPAFLTKLWKLVTDESCNELISWNYTGRSFIIHDEVRFSKELLPMYFKHNNMASFVRQLNMYGFRKLSCIDQGGMHSCRSEIEFYHQYFIKGQEGLLELIKRKIPSSKCEEPRLKQEHVEELVASVRALKGKQDFAESNMRKLKRENKALWDHVNFLTDRYSKQNNLMQQFIPFFMNVMKSSREMALKRKSPLMIGEGESTRNKVARHSSPSPPYYVHEQDSNMSMLLSRLSGLPLACPVCNPMCRSPSSPGNISNRGPVIHDVTELESSKMFPPSIMSSEGGVDSPLSCNLESSKFTEPGSMEALNVLNQNFESRSRSSSLGSSVDVKPSARSLGLCGGYSTPSAALIDETTSDVPSLMKAESPEGAAVYAGMSSLMSEQVAALIDEASMMEAPAMRGPSPPSFRNNCFLPPQMKQGMAEMNWMMNQPPPQDPEPSIDNWLGQIIKSDNLTPGCSLPQTSTTALPGNMNFGYVNYPDKRT